MVKKYKNSVIIPTYNSSISLEKCVLSVLGQTLKPYEIIVVNDGSIDDTADVAKKFGDKIIYIEQTNQGQGAARNTGLRVATGEFIVFLDSDDYILPGFLETASNFLEKHPEAVAVNTGHIIKRLDQENYGPVLNKSDKLKFEGGAIVDDFFKFWATYDHIRTGTAAIRKAVIDKAGFQRADLRISQDLEYWGYIATFGKWGFISKPLWIGNSHSVAAKQGWLKKYKQRRKLCPSVDSWEKRIVPRLKNDELSWFNIVRGRVASSYAHNKILAGNRQEARQIVLRYGESMPKTKLARLMRLGAKYGPLGWMVSCLIIFIKEYSKAISPIFVKNVSG